MVVGLAFDVGADDRGVGVHGPTGVDHRIELLVLDVDQLQGITSGVVIFGNDKGHLLALVADLVGGQDGDHVVAERRGPGQVQRLQHRAGDDGHHLGVGLGGRGVDVDDAGVGHRAAEHGAVEHARTFDVVEVVAFTPDEADVFLAGCAAEADGGLVTELRGTLGNSHLYASLPLEEPLALCSAAQRIDRTMFS